MGRALPYSKAYASTDSRSDSASSSDSETERRSSRGPVLHRYRDVLKPLSVAQAKDEDNWPCFLLEDAIIYLSDGKTMASVLDVITKGPCIVVGRLEFEDDDPSRKYLTHAKYENCRIKIDGVSLYSFGTRADSLETGHVIVWVGCEYGWFEVKPNKAFEPVYADMAKIVNAYYFLQTLYKRKGARDLKIEEVLSTYAAQEGSGATRQETENLMKRHAGFLLCQMNKKEGVNFETTVFYNWLAASCPDVLADLKKANIIIKRPALVPSAAIVTLEPPPEDSEPEEESADEQPEPPSAGAVSQRRRLSPYHPDQPETVDTSDVVAVIVDVMEGARNDPARIKPHRFLKTTFASVMTWLYYDWSITWRQIAGELIKMNAAAVMLRLDPAWKSTLVYKELKECVAGKKEILGSTETHRQLARNTTELKRRERKSRGPNAAASAENGDSTSRPTTPAVSNRRASSPKPQIKTSATPAATGKAAIQQRQDEWKKSITSGESVEPHSSKTIPSSISGKPSGKRATLHPANFLKRPLPEEYDEDSDERPRGTVTLAANRGRGKRTRSSQEESPVPSDTGASLPSSSSSSGNDSNADWTIKYSSAPLYTIVANTKDGAWACDIHAPGSPCPEIIHDIESEEAQTLYRAHMDHHAKLLEEQDDARAAERQKLAISEGVRLGHGVSNLIEKLKISGKAARLAEEESREVIGGKKVPMPIKRYHI